MHTDCRGVAHPPGILVVSQPPGRYKDSAAYGFDEDRLPRREVLPGEHLAPPVVGHVVYLAQYMERESRISHLEPSTLKDVLHLARGEYLYVADVVALPAVDR